VCTPGAARRPGPMTTLGTVNRDSGRRGPQKEVMYR
jgi:hypothetical protein